MNLQKLNEWLMLLANVGVIAGIVFLALEIRTNTQTNVIEIQEAFSNNWISINSLLATREMAEVLEKAAANEELSGIERRQLLYVVNLYGTQGNLMRRLYERGIASEEDFRNGYRAFRTMAREMEYFRKEVERRSDLQRSLVLDDDGLDRYIEAQR